APAVPVAWKVTGLPVSEPDVAVRVLVPAVVPSFHEPTVATPLAFVVADPLVSEPPPVATANVTAAPATGLPYWSTTSAAGATPAFVFTVALCPSPAK